MLETKKLFVLIELGKRKMAVLDNPKLSFLEKTLILHELEIVEIIFKTTFNDAEAEEVAA